MALSFIQHAELISDQSSVVFSNIPQDGSALYLVGSAKTDRANVADVIRVTATNATGGGILYAYHSNPAGGGSSYAYGNPDFIAATGSLTNTEVFGTGECIIHNYTDSNNKPVTNLSGTQDLTITNGGTYLYINAGEIVTSSPITELTLTSAFGTNIKQYSSFTLYRFVPGSDGVTTVS